MSLYRFLKLFKFIRCGIATCAAAAAVHAQVSTLGTKSSDWHLEGTDVPTSYVVHTMSWAPNPYDPGFTLLETTVDYSGQALNANWLAFNASGLALDAFQEVHATYKLKFHWKRTDIPAPSFTYVTIASYATATTSPWITSWSADNGIGSPQITSSDAEGGSCEGTKTFKVNVSGGYAEKQVDLVASATAAPDPLGRSTSNTAYAVVGSSAKIKGVRIAYDGSQTFYKQSNQYKTPNDETSVTDAKIDACVHPLSTNGSVAEFGSTFTGVLEGTWEDPYHVWTTLGGHTMSDDLIDEYDSIFDSVSLPIDSSLLANGKTLKYELVGYKSRPAR